MNESLINSFLIKLLVFCWFDIDYLIALQTLFSIFKKIV